MTTIRTIRAVAVLSVLAAGALAGRARAHEFVCEKAAGLVATDAQGSPLLDESGNVTFTGEPGAVLHVSGYPSTIGFRVTLTNPLATDTSVVTAISDPLLALAHGRFGAEIGAGFSLPAGASASEVFTVRVGSQEECEQLFGALDTCGGNAFENAFTVTNEVGLAQCRARVVCEARPAACVYANTDAIPNVVTAFRADGDTGSLTPVAGSPFPTGGDGSGGGFPASNRIVAQIGRHLYASNSGSGTIGAFAIDPSTCALSLVEGSPFPAQRDLSGTSLATTPDGRYLYAGGTPAHAFAVAPNGALSPLSTLALPGSPDGMKVSPDGRLLAIAFPSIGQISGVGMYRIAADGSLTEVPGSPFPVGPGRGQAASVDINCASNLLFVGAASLLDVVDVFAIAADDTLTPAGGTAFVLPGGLNSNVAALSPDERFLFVSNQGSSTITVASVGAGGSLTAVPGSPFPALGVPDGMATDSAGRFLYAGTSTSSVLGFRIGPDGTLTPVPGSPFPSPGIPMSVTVFPPKTCP